MLGSACNARRALPPLRPPQILKEIQGSLQSYRVGMCNIFSEPLLLAPLPQPPHAPPAPDALLALGIRR